jgi:hypothetical protein
VCCRGQDAVQPCLLVLVARSCEGGPRELFSVEAVGRLLRRVGAYGKSTFDGFRSAGLSKGYSVSSAGLAYS